MEGASLAGAPQAKKARGRPSRSLSQCEEEPIALYLESFLNQLNDSLNSFKKNLMGEIKSVLEESLAKPIVDSITTRIDSVISNSSLNKVGPDLSEKRTYAQVLAAQRDLRKYPEKETQVVLCNLPESDDPQETNKADRAALSALFQETSMKEKFEKGQIEWYRHPKDKPRNSKTRGRPLKIKLENPQSQVHFLKEADRARRTVFPTQPHIFVRRDLNPTELKIDADLRKECGIKNSECGVVKFVVRDLEIYEIKNPKHLVQKNVVVQPATRK